MQVKKSKVQISDRIRRLSKNDVSYISDLRIKGRSGGLNFKILKVSKFIAYSIKINKLINSIAHEQFRREQSAVHVPLAINSFAFYPQNLKKTLHALLTNSFQRSPEGAFGQTYANNCFKNS